MSILIKGLNMPKGDGLVISIEPNGEVYVQTQEGFSFFASKAKAVEVPTPHGRLIDADKMVQFLHHQECDSCKTPNSDECFACGEPFAEAVTDLQPTVIEAEEQRSE